MTDYVLDLFRGTTGTVLETHVDSTLGQSGSTWGNVSGGSGAMELSPVGLRLTEGTVTPPESAWNYAAYKISNIPVLPNDFDVEVTAAFNPHSGGAQVAVFNNAASPGVLAFSNLVFFFSPDSISAFDALPFSVPALAMDGTPHTFLMTRRGAFSELFVDGVSYGRPEHVVSSYNGPEWTLNEFGVPERNATYVPPTPRPINKAFGLAVQVNSGDPGDAVVISKLRIGPPEVVSRFWTGFKGTAET